MVTKPRKYWKDKADALWSKKIKERDRRCIICGSICNLQAHHIISRRCYSTRYLLKNGATLCDVCHDKAREIGEAAFCVLLFDNIEVYEELKTKSRELSRYFDFREAYKMLRRENGKRSFL